MIKNIEGSLNTTSNNKPVVELSLFERAFYEANKIKITEREKIYRKYYRG